MTLATVLGIIAVLIVLAVAWKLAETWIGEWLPAKIKTTIYLLVCLLVFLWLMQVLFGFSLPGMRAP